MLVRLSGLLSSPCHKKVMNTLHYTQRPCPDTITPVWGWVPVLIWQHGCLALSQTKGSFWSGRGVTGIFGWHANSAFCISKTHALNTRLSGPSSFQTWADQLRQFAQMPVTEGICSELSDSVQAKKSLPWFQRSGSSRKTEVATLKSKHSWRAVNDRRPLLSAWWQLRPEQLAFHLTLITSAEAEAI